jgi:glycosyltransferase involved in cell wall biosynthesis
LTQIALVTTSYPDRAAESGKEAAGAFVADFAAELSRHARVHVVAAAGEASVESAGDLTVHRFAVPMRPLSLLRPAHPADWPKILASLRAGQRALDRVAAVAALDHVLALWALPSGAWARRLQRHSGVPYSTWSLGSDIWSLGAIPVVRSVLARVLRDARHRYADGAVLCDDVAAIAGVPCAFLPSSRRLDGGTVEPPRSSPPYRLAFLGRWHANKGADLLLDALAELDDDDWRRIDQVRFCGGGPMEDAVRAGVARLQAARRPVELRGYLDRGEATELYRWADYLLLPSRIESIPVIFSDAVQCGLPLISTPVGDLGRLVSTYGVGVLAEEPSSAAMRVAIAEALQRSPADMSGGLERARADFDVGAAARRFYDAVA